MFQNTKKCKTYSSVFTFAAFFFPGKSIFKNFLFRRAATLKMRGFFVLKNA